MKNQGIEKENLNKNADIAFNYLASKCNFRRSYDNDMIALFTTQDEKIGTYKVVGVNSEEKALFFSINDLPTQEDGKIAVVVFENNQASEIFIFGVELMKAGKPSKVFKLLKKENLVMIKIKNHKKKYFQTYKFGIVLDQYIKNIY